MRKTSLIIFSVIISLLLSGCTIPVTPKTITIYNPSSKPVTVTSTAFLDYGSITIKGGEEKSFQVASLTDRITIYEEGYYYKNASETFYLRNGDALMLTPNVGIIEVTNLTGRMLTYVSFANYSGRVYALYDTNGNYSYRSDACIYNGETRCIAVNSSYASAYIEFMIDSQNYRTSRIYTVEKGNTTKITIGSSIYAYAEAL